MSIGLVMSGEMVGFVFKDAVAVSWFRFFFFFSFLIFLLILVSFIFSDVQRK